MSSHEVERLVEVIRNDAPLCASTGLTAGEKLERVATPDDLPYLREVLTGCDTDQGYLASIICLILARHGSASDILLIVGALGRRYGREFYRCAVLEALPLLVERDPEAAAPIIRELLASHRPDDREHAAALYPHARDFLPLGPLIDASRAASIDVSITALDSLWADRDAPEVRARYLEALSDPDDMVVETAVEQLGAGEDIAAIPHLLPLEQHRSERVRAAARAALIRLRLLGG